MNISSKKTPSKDGQVLLQTLQQVVKQTLERKKRLGEYVVIWKDGKPVTVGDDAPGEDAQRSTL